MAQVPTQGELRHMAGRWLPEKSLPERFRVFEDAADIYDIGCGDVLVLQDRAYLIRQNVREGRFGLEDEVKFWVKRALDLADGSAVIVKIPFFEKFEARIAGITFECFRSPRKEARILELVKDHPSFMHGFSALDAKDNLVRILEFIRGKPLSSHVEDLPVDHATYFREIFPDILDNYMECVEAIAFLHANSEKHGDIRRDHILIDADDGRFRWIDFDYNYRHRENIAAYDLFGLGNILAHIVGKGDVIVHELKERDPATFAALWGEDLGIVFKNRVFNLRKIYPYVPESLNSVLLHFSLGAGYHYEDVPELLADLSRARADIRRKAA